MVGLFNKNVADLPVNISLSYSWCGGFLLSFFMVIQIVSGVLLSFFYIPSGVYSFFVVYGVIGDSFITWVIRYIHIWGVSFIFILLYFHIGRALYYSSYSKLGVWNIGFMLYLLLLVEALLGYILPWHQMSFWAATVLTSVIGNIPLLGETLYKFVVGGVGINSDMLCRVYSCHICLAFILIFFMLLHLFYLHEAGSSNPLYLLSESDQVLFHSFFTGKDVFLILLFIFFLCSCIFVFPDMTLDSESFIEANSLLTPTNIKPEWYFLCFYAMLRSIESKMGGLILVIVFLFLVWLPSFNLCCVYSLSRQVVFWFISILFLLLSYIGACHPGDPYTSLSLYCSLLLLLSLFFFKCFWSSANLVIFPNSFLCYVIDLCESWGFC